MIETEAGEVTTVPLYERVMQTLGAHVEQVDEGSGAVFIPATFRQWPGIDFDVFRSICEAAASEPKMPELPTWYDRSMPHEARDRVEFRIFERSDGQCFVVCDGIWARLDRSTNTLAGSLSGGQWPQVRRIEDLDKMADVWRHRTVLIR